MKQESALYESCSGALVHTGLTGVPAGNTKTVKQQFISVFTQHTNFLSAYNLTKGAGPNESLPGAQGRGRFHFTALRFVTHNA
jgi:hypothetical protein